MYKSTGWGLDNTSPYSRTQPFLSSIPQHYEIIRVNGQAGAKNFRMAPNSSALLLDETAPILWCAQTDGAGYLSVTPFDILPHQTPAPVDLNDLLMRVSNLEEALKNVQPSIGNSTKLKKQRQQPNAATESQPASLTTN